MNGDVLQRLAEARPEVLDPEAQVDDHTRSLELAQAMSAPRTQTPAKARRPVRPMWGLGLVGAAAAAALVVATTATGPGSGSGDGGGEKAQPSATPSERPVSRLNARTVLLATAAGASRQPVATGKYWHSQIDYGVIDQVGPAKNRYVVLHRYRQDSWDPQSPKVEGWFRSTDYGAKPDTPADEAAWRSDGSPTAWSTGIHGKQMELQMNPRDASFAHSTGRAADAPDKLNVTQRELDRTAADPAKLRALILAHPLGEADDGVNSDVELFDAAAGILLSRPLKPATRAALYRLLAEIKGVSAVDGARDAAGRPGTVLKMRQQGKDGLSEIHFIVDRSTGAGLAKEIHYLKGVGRKAWLKPGARWYYEVTTSQWVDTLPPMPRPPRGS